MNYKELRETIVRYYKLNQIEADKYLTELDSIRFDGVTDFDWINLVFPYKFVNEVRQLKIQSKRLPSGIVEVSCDGKLKVCYPSIYTQEQCESAYRLLLIEQHVDSPHRYTKAPVGTSVIDVGCSEGIFGLMYCDSSNDLYCWDESIWMHALFETLDGRNVTFFNEFINNDTQINIQLKKPLGCVKIDTEGSEIEVLSKLRPLIVKDKPQLQIACYHYQTEADEVYRYLRNILGYKKVFSRDKYMTYPQDPIQYPPYFRNSILFTERE